MVLSKQGLIGKDPDAGKDRRWEKGVTEDEMVGWHHWLDGHEFGWTPRVGDGQGGLACCSPWGHKESDSTGRLSWTDWNKGYLFRNTRVLANNIPFPLFSGKICIIQERIARCLWNFTFWKLFCIHSSQYVMKRGKTFLWQQETILCPKRWFSQYPSPSLGGQTFVALSESKSHHVVK